MIAIATAEPATTRREPRADSTRPPVIDREAFDPAYRHLDEDMLAWLVGIHSRRGRRRAAR